MHNIQCCNDDLEKKTVVYQPKKNHNSLHLDPIMQTHRPITHMQSTCYCKQQCPRSYLSRDSGHLQQPKYMPLRWDPMIWKVAKICHLMVKHASKISLLFAAENSSKFLGLVLDILLNLDNLALPHLTGIQPLRFFKFVISPSFAFVP